MLKSKIVVGMVAVALASFAGASFAAETMENNDAPKSHETTGVYMSNAKITAKVKADLLADSDISSMHISVKTVHGVVTLRGHVFTAEQKEKAASIASAVEGVKSVKNHLMVKHKRG